MATTKKISEYGALTSPAAGDLLEIVDVSDTSAAPTGTNKKIAVSDLVSGGVVPDDSVTNAKLANMAQATIKGRASGAGTGDPTDLTPTEVKTLLAIASTDVTDFAEAVQDVAGALIVDSATIDFSYNDATGEVTGVVIGAAPSGSAGGDLSGSYPNPSVIKASLTAAHGSDDTWTGTTIAGLNAGATIAQWEAVYLGGSSTWLLADANGSGTYPARGLATAAYSSTNPAVILVHGTVRNDAWNWTPGGTIYLSATAGALTQTAPSTSGDKVQQVGFALTADIAFFDFNNTFLTVT